MASAALIIVKLAFIAVIFCLAFISGILPRTIPWCKNSINVLGIANAFSGGIFLAIAFMHIIPEAARDYDEFMHHHHDDDEIHYGSLRHGDDGFFPLPFALVFAGYATILLIDKVIFDTHSLVGEHHHGHTDDPVQTHFIENAKSSFIKFQRMASDNAGHHHGHDHDSHDHDHTGCINESQINEGIKQYLSKNDKFAVRMSVALRRQQLKKYASRTFANQDKGLDDEQAELFQDKSNIDLRDAHGNDDTHVHAHETEPKKCNCNLTPIVLMIALSSHAVFEGIAVGVVDELKDLWTYVIAIALHKWAEAMSLGISMSKNFKEEGNGLTYLLIGIFSLATPIGIGIGMLVSGSSALTSIIFFSIAGGSFIYIACSEVIVEEFSTPEYKWIKMFFFLLGAVLITCLNFIEG